MIHSTTNKQNLGKPCTYLILLISLNVTNKENLLWHICNSSTWMFPLFPANLREDRIVLHCPGCFQLHGKFTKINLLNSCVVVVSCPGWEMSLCTPCYQQSQDFLAICFIIHIAMKNKLFHLKYLQLFQRTSSASYYIALLPEEGDLNRNSREQTVVTTLWSCTNNILWNI